MRETEVFANKITSIKNEIENLSKLMSETTGEEFTDNQCTMLFNALNAAYELKEDQVNVAEFIKSYGISLNAFTGLTKIVVEPKEVLESVRSNKLPRTVEELYRGIEPHRQTIDEETKLSFLSQYGFTEEKIQALNDGMSQVMVDFLAKKSALIEANLKYLKDLGVTNLEEIFTEYYELFLSDPSKFNDIFGKYDREDLIEKLAKNVAIVEYL